MNLIRGLRLAAVLTATLLTATGCDAVRSYTAGTPGIFLDPSIACPHTLGSAQDVRNAAPGLRSGLVPPDRPSSALICAYQAPASTGVGQPRLHRTVRLSADAAHRLTRDLPHVSLKRPRGKYNCPAGLSGSITVIAFAYVHRPAVDLWYSSTGCETVDNGYVIASQAGNPSFYEHFEKQFDAVMR